MCKAPLWLLLPVAVLFANTLGAQSSFYVTGYAKDLFSISKPYQAEAIIDNLVHQRTNLYWSAKKHWSAKASLRTRFFYGDTPGSFPFLGQEFGDVIDMATNDFFDLSFGFDVGDRGYVHSYFDRLYVDYLKDDLQVRLGRQRINWGIHTIWNPNDIFNAYNFADFDYEERAGTDALMVRFYRGALSETEFAIKAFDNWEDAVFGFMFRTNRGSYDVQILLAVQENQFVFGNGWAGNVGQWSFKGEWSAFAPLQADLDFGLSATIGWEYITESGISFNFSGLFNSDGKTDGTLGELFIFQPSARNLYPFKWSFLASAGWQAHPLIYVNGIVIYSAATSHPLFFNPAVTWSALPNFDVDVVFQIAFNADSGRYVPAVQGYFARVKYSF